MDNYNTLSRRSHTTLTREDVTGDASPARYPELVHSLLNAVSRAYAEGKSQRVRKYGLTLGQAQDIAAMSAHDLHSLSQAGAELFDVRVNGDALDSMLDRLAVEKKEDRLLDRLLMLDAPAQMMQQLFGLTAAECATRRKVLGITATTGRPRAPSEDEEHAIWSAWRGTRGLSTVQRLETVAAETSLPLSLIWSQLRRWEREGADPDHLPADPEPTVYATAAEGTGTVADAAASTTPSHDGYSRLARLRARLLHRGDSEGEQSLIRLLVSLAVIVYGITVAPLDDYHASLGAERHRLMIAGIATLFLWPVGQLVWLLTDPRANVTRRYGGLVYDAATLTWFMWHLGQFGGLMYMVYLWIIIGHGLRFGVPNLIAATVLCMTGFGLVLAGNGFWYSHLGLGIGLLAGMAAVPLYTYSLIRGVTRSKLRAHRSRLATLPAPAPMPATGAVQEFPTARTQPPSQRP